MVGIMGILSHLFFGSRANKDCDIPTLIDKGALVIDVRSADEFSGGHIEGAINIPHHVIARAISDHTTNKTQPIIVYCFSGGRSAAAKKSLNDMDYTTVENGGSLEQMRTRTGL